VPPRELEPAIRPDAAPRSPRDERGSTLVLVLALVIFISIAAVAVLDQETTASNAQRAYENLRVGDQAADSTVNALIHTMRYSQAQGAAAPEVVPSGTLCSNTTGWSQVNGQQVYCQADPSSLTLQRDASDLPPNAILTLGGLDGRGNRQADTSATPASYNAPFCDDYHDFQAGGSSDRCETGLFVGRGVSDTSTNGGGLYVAETGRVDRTPPLVASNSSIVINPANSLRSLTVDGTVWARRGCGSGAGTTLDASQIFAGHDPKTGASDAARRLCAGGSDPTKWQNALNACRSQLPTGGSFNSSAFQAFRSCLSDHGVTMPANGGFAGINRNDPKFVSAMTICRPLLPNGGNGPTTTTKPSSA